LEKLTPVEVEMRKRFSHLAGKKIFVSKNAVYPPIMCGKRVSAIEQQYAPTLIDLLIVLDCEFAESSSEADYDFSLERLRRNTLSKVLEPPKLAAA
jgi:hypothetical protein